MKFVSLAKWRGATYEMSLVLREQSLRFSVGDASVNDDIFAFLPIDRGRNAVLVTELKSINRPDYLILHEISVSEVDRATAVREARTKLRPATAG